MTTYIYKVTCPSCDRVHSIARDEPYVRPRLHKLCTVCRIQKDDEVAFQGVEDCGSLHSKRGCFNCAHFTPSTDGRGWGECGLGHAYDSEHPDEYAEPLDLVYELDSCSAWEVEDDGQD